MFDAKIQYRLQPILNHIASFLHRRGCTANQMTIAGFLAGLVGCVGVGLEMPLLGLCGWAINRLCDGIDGPLARLRTPHPFGAYLDILCDMIIYGGIVFAHTLAHPADAVWACFLLSSFLACSTSFLAAAIMAQQTNMTAQPLRKGFFYDRGLAEGFETIIALSLMILMPAWFPMIAGIFGVLCWLTTLQRTIIRYQGLKGSL